VLLLLVAVAVVAALDALGALLVAALLVVPAATARLWSRRLLAWQLSAVVLTGVEGIVGLWLSVELNVPPGAAIAVLAGGVFALVAAARRLPGARRIAVVGAGAVAIASLGAGCVSAGADSHGRPIVVATTTQIGDWARVVGGRAVDVHQILQPNTDPHEYEPRPADVEATADARLVLENGDGLDGWMGKVVSEAGGHATVVVIGDHVPIRLPGESSGPEASAVDPHWWHDPRNAEAAVRAIRDSLVRANPGARAGIERRAKRYLGRLRALDRRIAACFAVVPRRERKLVTDHDAFAYFAHRYGIEVVGAVIPSQSTQAQPSAGDTARLIALVRREHVRAIFPESSVNPRLADTIARETGATSSYRLYGDTLGPSGSSGSTYLGMENANADSMVRGFTGGRQRCETRG
jgi:ABC-type Zn uptake system ZnuABC Zn-binding protein ZnuA